MTARTKGQEVSLWAGLAAFFGSVLAVGAFDLFGIDGLAEFAISILVAVFTAGAVYAQQRLGFAKGEDEPAKPTTYQKTSRK